MTSSKETLTTRSSAPMALNLGTKVFILNTDQIGTDSIV